MKKGIIIFKQMPLNRVAAFCYYDDDDKCWMYFDYDSKDGIQVDLNDSVYHKARTEGLLNFRDYTLDGILNENQLDLEIILGVVLTIKK